jgi:hypothetical protein
MHAVRAYPPRLLFVSVVLLAAVGSSTGAATLARSPAGTARAHRAVATAAGTDAARLPLTFTRNAGQDSPAVRYIGQEAGVTVLFTETGVTLDLARTTAKAAAGAPDPGSVPGRDAQTVSVGLDFLRASRRPWVTGSERQAGTVSYFQGDDPGRWHTAIPTFAQVVYHSVWPGINVIFTARDGVLRYSFTLTARANPTRIRLAYAGARRLTVDRSGALAISTPAATLDDQAPVGTQPVAGHPTPIAVRYQLLGHSTFGFALRRRAGTPLTIDPGLDYSTFLGGSVADSAFSVQSDAAGDLYVFGQSASPDFPTTPGAYQRQLNAKNGGDFFVTKLNPSGTGLVYSTFVGGTDFQGIANGVVDGSGDVYVTGETGSGDFPTTAGAYRRKPFLAPDQSVVFKLNPTGSRLLYSTYLAPGLISSGLGRQIGLAPGGSVVVIGTISSDYAPTTPGAFEPAYPGGDLVGYAARLNATGSRLIYATYLGAPVTSQPDPPAECPAWGLATDANGDAYITSTCVAGFPTTPGAYQPKAAPGGALLVKLDPDGTRLDYATYWGHSRSKLILQPDAVAVDKAGDAYLDADAPPHSVPVTPGAFESKCTSAGAPAPYCTAVAEFNPTGTGLVYSTYFGSEAGGKSDTPEGIAVDSHGLAYVVGIAVAKNIPTTPGAYSPAPGPFGVPFYLAVFGKGTLLYATYFGGTGFSKECVLGICSAIAGDITISSAVASGAVYLGGTTDTSHFPVSPGGFQQSYPGGANNPWAAKLELPPLGSAARRPPPAIRGAVGQHPAG